MFQALRLCGAPRAFSRSVACLLVGTFVSAPSIARGANDREDPSQHFAIQPVSDGVTIALGTGFSVILGLVLGTGEIQPLKAGSQDNLLPLDRIAVTQTIDPHAGLYSDIGLYTGIGFAALDSVWAGISRGKEAGFVDAVMYAESVSLTLAFDDITKIAVRRPRPSNYLPANATNTTNTDLALSFFSGHEATLASISGTATYLAFAHDPNGARPWITLAAGALLTGFVGFERVRAGDHFPTDIIMGAVAGASIGVLVPHLHRQGTRPVWIDFAPTPGGVGGNLTVKGVF